MLDKIVIYHIFCYNNVNFLHLILNTGNYSIERTGNIMRKLTVELTEKFKQMLYEEEKSKNTIDKYMRDIKMFTSWLGEKELDKGLVVEYKKTLCENYAPRSVNSMLSSINALFMWLSWYDLKVKTLKIQRRIFADKEKELTKSEYEKLLSTAQKQGNERLYYLMQTIASTGIRISELPFITVEAINCGKAIIDCKGKLRYVFIPHKLCKMLKEYAQRNEIKKGSLFISRTGKPLNRSNIWNMLKKLCQNAGVSKDKVFPHNFRHLFARTYYSLEKDIVRLADILGHSSINTTRIYTIESGDIHVRQIQKLGLLRC